MSATRNPEDDVVDAIDELVNESLARGPTDDSRRPFRERCALCGYEWHGLTGDGTVGVQGCPGAYATDEQADRWRSWWRFPRMWWDTPFSSWNGNWNLPDNPFNANDWFGNVEITPEHQAQAYTIDDIERLRGGFAASRTFSQDIYIRDWTVDDGTEAADATVRGVDEAMRELHRPIDLRCEQCERYMPGIISAREGYYFTVLCAQCNEAGEHAEIRRFDMPERPALEAPVARQDGCTDTTQHVGCSTR